MCVDGIGVFAIIKYEKSRAVIVEIFVETIAARLFVLKRDHMVAPSTKSAVFVDESVRLQR